MLVLKKKFKYLGYLILLTSIIFEFFRENFPKDIHKGFFSMAFGLLLIYLSTENLFYDLKNKLFFKSFLFCWIIFYLVIYIFGYSFSVPEFILCLLLLSLTIFKINKFIDRYKTKK